MIPIFGFNLILCNATIRQPDFCIGWSPRLALGLLIGLYEFGDDYVNITVLRIRQIIELSEVGRRDVLIKNLCSPVIPYECISAAEKEFLGIQFGCLFFPYDSIVPHVSPMVDFDWFIL